MADYTIDELIITCMARELHGEVLVSSVTALGALAAHLAKSTHAPDLAVLSTPESGMDAIPMPTLSLGQFLTDNQRAIPLSMEDIFDAIFTDRFRIWINPAQIDQHGNVNISVIGPWAHPKVALVGSRGIPEDTSHLSQGLYYLTSHSPRTVIAQVDFISGVGYTPERAKWLGAHGAPTCLVTDLGVFGWNPATGRMIPRSLHPGVGADQVRERTGFPLEIPSALSVTTPPTADEIAIIHAADPLEVRKLELLSGKDAAEKFAVIYERERQTLHAAWPRRR
ncbi:MAG TPA: CoA-transferase, partial [bacterium]|nr:CoA-transferase [bacterium]